MEKTGCVFHGISSGEEIVLVFPSSGTPFNPKVSYFLGGLDVFDREETLGVEIRSYDPNDPLQREEVIKKYILPGDWVSHRHKYLLMKPLEAALEDECFDFSKEFSCDYEGDEYNLIAWDEAEISDPKGFFEDIYRLAQEAWREDLSKASLEDKSTW